MGPYIAWRNASVPLAPDDASYAQATRLRLHVSAAIPADQGRVMLTLDYLGDAARLYAGGELVDDHFYDGEPWQIGIDRFASGGQWPVLELAILAAGEAPMFLEPAARRRLAAATSPAELCSARVTVWRTRRFDPSTGAFT
jgi:hypothetical protein